MIKEKEKNYQNIFYWRKKIKTKRLRDVIATEEAKFWKFISRNIYLNNQRIELDKRLLKNYYFPKDIMMLKFYLVMFL